EVSVGTVTAQLLYEIGAPRYENPDVTARFDTLDLVQAGPDRVRVEGVRGAPPPQTTKVCLNYHGGFKNSVTFLLVGLDVEAKAKLIEETMWANLGGRDAFAETHVSLHRADEAATSLEQAFSFLTISVKDPDPKKVGRRFSGVAVEMALASYPGFNLTAPPGRESPYGVYWPALVASDVVGHQVVFEGEAIDIRHTPGAPHTPSPLVPPTSHPIGERSTPGALREAPLGRICGARSGDKGGNANLGVWTESDEAFDWLQSWLTVDRLRELIPEARDLPIDRYLFPNLRALNFVLRGFLGDGVAASLATDAQAKGLGEYLRAKQVPIPLALLDEV
ncbi:MAG: acyclic terpene utilization AtuA family protein, partial [Acidobacteriota bacterium]